MSPCAYTIVHRTYDALHPLHDELHFSASKNYLFELPHFAVLTAQGDKAAEFLQGQVTCDLRQVTATNMRRGALCNLKGRILALLDILDWQGYHLVLPEDLLAETQNSLAKTAMLSRVNLQKQDTWRVFGLLINDSSDLMPPMVLPTQANALAASDDYCCYSLGNNLFLALINGAKSQSMLHDFIPTQRRGALAWHYLQLLNHHVSIYPETRGLFLPHRLDLHTLGYISFDKGCYKGQEIIARTHYKAKLKHELQVFTLLSDEPPRVGSRIFAAGTQQEIGELIDYCPKGDDRYLIAVSIHFEHAQVVTLENHQGDVTLLDALD